MTIVPLTLKAANEFVLARHRHSKPVAGHKFSVGVEADGRLVGVAIVGRPVARALDNGRQAEILRVCTDGTPNACSMLYGASRKAARAMGYTAVFTYTLPEEGGASLRGAGFHLDAARAGRPSKGWHNRPDRTVRPVGLNAEGSKWRWVDTPRPSRGDLFGNP